jgi:hypothetical protein
MLLVSGQKSFEGGPIALIHRYLDLELALFAADSSCATSPCYEDFLEWRRSELIVISPSIYLDS